MSSEPSTVVPMIEPLAAVINQATVISVSDDSISINVAGISQPATTMYSCLVQPQAQDIVLYTRHESGMNYILGIMARPGNPDITLELPGNATLQSASGSLTMMASESVNLITPGKISCIASQAIHKSRKAVVDYAELIAQGNLLQASIKDIKIYSQSITTMARQVIERCKRYIRHSEESDQVKAAQMTRDISGLYSMDSKYTIMVSKKDTKIDGERIHMG